MKLVPLSVLARHPQSLKQKKNYISMWKAKRRIIKRVLQENKAPQIFRKTNITYPLTRTRACRIYVKPNISNRLKLLKTFENFLCLAKFLLSQGCRVTTRTHFSFNHLSPHKFLVLIWSTSERWKTESHLEQPSGFEPRTPGLITQHTNH